MIKRLGQIFPCNRIRSNKIHFLNYVFSSRGLMNTGLYLNDLRKMTPAFADFYDSSKFIFITYPQIKLPFSHFVYSLL
jgi:hypothetical protein